MSLKPSATVFSVAACVLLAATGCLLQEKDDSVKEYPISPGRYYRAVDLQSASRDSVLFYTEFSSSATRFLDVRFDRPGCPTDLVEGPWHAFTSDERPERQLRKFYRRGAGSTFNTECLSLDSLPDIANGDGEVVSLRQVTDSSFETCEGIYELCYGLCTAENLSLQGGCSELDGSGPHDSDWTVWVK